MTLLVTKKKSSGAAKHHDERCAHVRSQVSVLAHKPFEMIHKSLSLGLMLSMTARLFPLSIVKMRHCVIFSLCSFIKPLSELYHTVSRRCLRFLEMHRCKFSLFKMAYRVCYSEVICYHFTLI